MMVSIRVLKERYPEDKGYYVERNTYPKHYDIHRLALAMYEGIFEASRSYVTVWDDIGGIVAEFNGYVPKGKSGTVLYDDGETDGYWLNRIKVII